MLLLCWPIVFVSVASVSVRRQTKHKRNKIPYLENSSTFYNCIRLLISDFRWISLTMPLSTTSWSSVNTIIILDGTVFRASTTLNCNIIDDQLKIQTIPNTNDILRGIGNILSHTADAHIIVT